VSSTVLSVSSKRLVTQVKVSQIRLQMLNPASLLLAAAAASANDLPALPRPYFTDEEYQEAHVFAATSGLYPGFAAVSFRSLKGKHAGVPLSACLRARREPP